MSRTHETLSLALKAFLPPAKIKLSDWAEKNLELDPATSAEPGRFNLRKTPYLREIMDCVTDPSVEKVTWIASARVGKTQFCLAVAGYYTEHDPSPILFVEPSEALATYASELFTSQANHNPKIKRLLEDKGSKDNILTKTFPGGSLFFASAASYNNLIARTIRIILLDEVDGYGGDLKGRGNPLELAKDRSFTYANRKIITVSVPGTEGLSNVSKAYKQSDMREYHVPCPHCGGLQELVFRNLHWLPGSEGRGAWYQCEHCQSRIEEHHRPSMVEHGVWVATNPDGEPRHVGFRINQFCSLLGDASFEKIATRFIKVERDNDIADRKVFVNQVFGETWNDNHINRVSDNEIMARAEGYNAEVPLGVGTLCAGCDFQKDRVEVSTYGFGKNRQIWLIDHKVIHGDVEQDPASPASQLYVELDQYLNRPFRHESGREIYIRTAFLDVGDGTRTHQIRKFCFPRMTRKVFAIMGAKRPIGAIFTGSHVKDTRTKHPVYFVDGAVAKQELFHRLQIKYETQPGYIHFPRYAHIDEEFYKQLTNQKLVEKLESGVLKRKWLPRYKNSREEAIDCFVYALGAFEKEWKDKLSVLDEVCDVMASPYEAPEEPEEHHETPSEKPNNSAAFDFYAKRRQMTGG